MDRVVECPLDGVQFMAAAAEMHVNRHHAHLLPGERSNLIKFLKGES